jgi:hypothetical protein
MVEEPFGNPIWTVRSWLSQIPVIASAFIPAFDDVQHGLVFGLFLDITPIIRRLPLAILLQVSRILCQPLVDSARLFRHQSISFCRHIQVPQELIFRLAHGQRRHGRHTSHYEMRSLLVGGLLKKWVMAVKSFMPW